MNIDGVLHDDSGILFDIDHLPEGKVLYVVPREARIEADIVLCYPHAPALFDRHLQATIVILNHKLWTGEIEAVPDLEDI